MVTLYTCNLFLGVFFACSISKQVWLLLGNLIDRVGTFKKTYQTMYVNTKNCFANILDDCWTKFGASMDFMSKLSAYSRYKRAS